MIQRPRRIHPLPIDTAASSSAAARNRPAGRRLGEAVAEVMDMAAAMRKSCDSSLNIDLATTAARHLIGGSGSPRNATDW